MAAVTPNIEHSGCMMTNARPPEPTPREALLARESCSASGDDPVMETDDGPEPVRPPAEPAIHPFTGKFADPELAAAYRSRAFRMMMPPVGFDSRIWHLGFSGGNKTETFVPRARRYHARTSGVYYEFTEVVCQPARGSVVCQLGRLHHARSTATI